MKISKLTYQRLLLAGIILFFLMLLATIASNPTDIILTITSIISGALIGFNGGGLLFNRARFKKKIKILTIKSKKQLK